MNEDETVNANAHEAEKEASDVDAMGSEERSTLRRPAHGRMDALRLSHVVPGAVVVVLLLTVGLLVQFWPSAAQRVGVLATSSKYVSLSIDDPEGLPTALVPGASFYFSFTVSSSDSSTAAVRWVVTTVTAGRPVGHGITGSVRVAPGGRVSVPVVLVMPSVNGAIAVQVAAPGQGLSPLEFHVAARPVPKVPSTTIPRTTVPPNTVPPTTVPSAGTNAGAK